MSWSFRASALGPLSTLLGHSERLPGDARRRGPVADDALMTVFDPLRNLGRSASGSVSSWAPGPKLPGPLEAGPPPKERRRRTRRWRRKAPVTIVTIAELRGRG